MKLADAQRESKNWSTELPRDMAEFSLTFRVTIEALLLLARVPGLGNYTAGYEVEPTNFPSGPRLRAALGLWPWIARFLVAMAWHVNELAVHAVVKIRKSSGAEAMPILSLIELQATELSEAWSKFLQQGGPDE